MKIKSQSQNKVNLDKNDSAYTSETQERESELSLSMSVYTRSNIKSIDNQMLPKRREVKKDKVIK